ncbi:hypothetical protein ACFQDD_06970 [Halorubrum pallidum]|uniref:DUF8025 domain-containing protein n=1 Tax=Halorubrum pallidum TaxID=1526114 RepID=A0ABD5T1U9_9EURY
MAAKDDTHDASNDAQTAADPEVFADDKITGLDEGDLLGTHVFEDVLFTGESDVVNVLTGETPAEQDRTVQEAKAFVERTQEEGKAPRVAVKQPPEAAVESRSPYTSSAFCNRKITGSLARHFMFLGAWRSDAYEVDIEADYQSGDVTITVEVAE